MPMGQRLKAIAYNVHYYKKQLTVIADVRLWWLNAFVACPTFLQK